jgi:hypothetical protein
MRWCALPAVLATLVLTAATATASRGIQFSVESGELGRVGLSGSWTMNRAFRCRITATVSMASSIAKTAGTAAGRVTSFAFEAGEPEGCRFFFFVLPEDLPWTIAYQSFTGVLPNMTGLNLRLENVRFLYIAPGFFSCQYRGSFSARAESNPLRTLTIVEGLTSLVRSQGICGNTIAIDAALTLEPPMRMTLMT